MNTRIQLVIAFALSATVGFAATGCGIVLPAFGDSRLTNQGGGSLISALGKLTSANIGGLTGDEIQILSDSAKNLLSQSDPAAASLPALTDDQAGALANFFNSNGLNSPDAFGTFAQNAAADPGSVKGLDELAAAFAGSASSFDPNAVTEDDLNNLFMQVFGGTMP